MTDYTPKFTKENFEKIYKELKMFKTEGRSMSSKQVVFIGDMHVGSALALSSPNPYVSDLDTEIKPSKVMRTFYDTWVKCIDAIGKKPHVMAMLGEPMDGDNFKQIGQQSWTTNFNDQIADSIKLLKMWNAKTIVMVRGSGYHDHRGATNYGETVARQLGVRRYRAWGASFSFWT
ncbi:hypothetical protein LCGC14_2589460 [marine sediment metagenome]|uniref:Uncharacterized protein n=1 Tax=marine sediment metagenome TaxID=412755 RepID=A0A0F9CN50_9ZZZZ